MMINEIFYSLQGEGFLAGVASAFVRLAGCPLSCRYCDTMYAADYKAGDEMKASRVVERVKEYKANNVVITGGEPMVEADWSERKGLRELTNLLKRENKHITIETAGIKYVSGLSCDLMSISPKPELEESVDTTRELIRNYSYQLKFVIENKQDLSKAEGFLDALGSYDRNRVMLMPQAATKNEYLERAPVVAEFCKEAGLAFSPRLQVLLWDNKRGT